MIFQHVQTAMRKRLLQVWRLHLCRRLGSTDGAFSLYNLLLNRHALQIMCCGFCR